MNRNYGKLENSALVYAPNAVTVDGRLVLNPNAEQYAAAGWLPVVNNPAPSDAPEGKHYEFRSYEVAGGEIRRVYALVDDPPPAPRRFSKLRLYAAIAQHGLWGRLEEWLKAQTVEGLDAYTAFLLAQDISDDHPLFAPLYAAAKATLGVDDATAEAILAAAEEVA